MMSISFYLFGDPVDTAKTINLRDIKTLAALKKAVAETLHIAGKQELGFQNSTTSLFTFDEVINSSQHIAVTLDGRGVRQIEGPAGLPIFGNYFEIFPDHIGNTERLFKKYGPIVKTTISGNIAYTTNDPAITLLALAESDFFTKNITPSHPLWSIKDNTAIFVGDTDTTNWKLAHKFIPPCMSPKAVRHYTPMMQQHARGAFKVFDELDAADEFVLGMDFQHMETVDSPIHKFVALLSQMVHLNKEVSYGGKLYASLPFGKPQKLRNVRKALYAEIGTQVDIARSSIGSDLPIQDAAIDATNVLDYLLRAVDLQGEKFPPDLLYGNIVFICGAGFLTTSTLFSWLIYSLTVYPGMQKRLLQELVDHDIRADTVWTPELSNSLPFLNNFIKETQRLHNPSFQPARTSKTQVILPGGYRLPKDSILIAGLYGLHTNPDHWADPHRFDPDRWDTEEVRNRVKGSYLPFATGPRGCIGFNLALAEAKVFLPELVFRYEFEKQGDEAIEYDPEFLMIKPDNLYVRARRRSSWPAKSK